MTRAVVPIRPLDPMMLKVAVHGVLSCGRSLGMFTELELEEVYCNTIDKLSASSLRGLARVAKWMYNTIDGEARRRS